jgi:hypothetical protein
MYLVDGLIVLAIVFFFVLPIADTKTVRMKIVGLEQPRCTIGGAGCRSALPH